MRLAIALILTALFLLLPVLLFAVPVLIRDWLSRRADDAAEDAADQIAHGDIPHLPIGMTPRPLINHEGE